MCVCGGGGAGTGRGVCVENGYTEQDPYWHFRGPLLYVRRHITVHKRYRGRR